MHVGHLRSTVIGDAVGPAARAGSATTSCGPNHLGDWGTPFGMLIEHLLDLGEAEAAHELSVGDLDGFYQAARAKFDADDGVRRAVPAAGGGAAGRRRRRRCGCGGCWSTESQRYFLAVYDRLGVTLDRGRLRAARASTTTSSPPVVDELDRPGLLRESDGARVRVPGRASPAATASRCRSSCARATAASATRATDLAAIRYRIRRPRRDPAALRRRRAAAPALRDGLRGGARGRLAGAAGPGRARRLRLDPRRRRQDVPHPGRRARSSWPTCSTRRSRGPRRWSPRRTPTSTRRRRPRSRRRSASARSSTPTCPATGSRTTSSTGTGCSRSTATPAPYLQYAHARIRSIFRRAGSGARDPGPSRSSTPPSARSRSSCSPSARSSPRSRRRWSPTASPGTCTAGDRVQPVLRALPGAARRAGGAGEPAGAVRPDRPGAAPGAGAARHRHPRPRTF